MNLTHKRITGLVAASLLGGSCLHAYDWKAAREALSPQEQSIAETAALSAVGDLKKLAPAFDRALDNGLTVNELKEIVLQLYAYVGFPRCLNAAGVLEQVVKSRQAAQKGDLTGPEAQPIPAGTDRYELGKKNLEVLVAAPLPSHPPVFIQGTDTFLKEHLFADIFARGVLSYAQRETATVAALAALGNVAPQLQAHMGMAINVGVTPAKIAGILAVIKQTVGRKTARLGLKSLQQVTAARTPSKE